MKILRDSSNSNIYYFVVGCFSTTLFILKYDYLNNLLHVNNKIDNCCSSIKPGISSIDFIEHESKFYLVTGAYDYRFRIYEVFFTENIFSFCFQGFQNLNKNTIINQVKLLKDPNNESVYLFIGSDQNLLLIYTLI